MQVIGTSWAGSRGDVRLLARLGLSQAGLQDERDAEEKALAAKNRWRRKSSSQGQSTLRSSLPCIDICCACVRLEAMCCARLCCDMLCCAMLCSTVPCAIQKASYALTGASDVWHLHRCLYALHHIAQGEWP